MSRFLVDFPEHFGFVDRYGFAPFYCYHVPEQAAHEDCPDSWQKYDGQTFTLCICVLHLHNRSQLRHIP